jgi:hypothetical protein
VVTVLLESPDPKQRPPGQAQPIAPLTQEL